MDNAAFTPQELAQRRRRSARSAWLLFAAVTLLYAIGFLVPR